MSMRWVLGVAVVCVLAPSGTATAGDGDLSEADRRAFAWYDGIGLPSCAGRPFVRIRWENPRVPATAPEAERIWRLDGFLVAESGGMMTVLDGDLWPRRVERAPKDWKATVTEADVGELAKSAAARLRALVSDPGAAEPIDEFLHGVRIRFGEEGVALALARNCAASGHTKEARAILDAARALPPLPGAPKATFEETAAAQMETAILWRILFDFADGHPRADLLRRFRGWSASFPASRQREIADEAIRLLEPAVAADQARAAAPAVDLAALAPAARAKELVARLCDQGGDVRIEADGDTTLVPHGTARTVDALVAMGHDPVPALIEALDDPSFTRAVLFRDEMEWGRQRIARIGDMALVALERIAKRTFHVRTAETPSIFQGAGPAAAKAKCEAWWNAESGFGATLRAAAAASGADRAARIAALEDRGPGNLTAQAVWGTKSCLAAIPGVDAAAGAAFLRDVVVHAARPRTKVLAAWALVDLGDASAVPSVARLWRELPDAERADLVQGGAVASFLASCGDPAGIAALAEGLEARPPLVRELVVLAFGDRGLGAVRGFAADRGDGIATPWPRAADGGAAEAVTLAIEDLLARRLEDVAEAPGTRLPRQEPLCDMVPDFDCGRRVADGAIRMLALRWPRRYVRPDEPVHTASSWETQRTGFLAAWRAARAGGGKTNER